MALSIKIDQEWCIGSGRCCGVAPRVFSLDDSDKAAVVDPNADTEEIIKAAAKQCPTMAISVVQDGIELDLHFGNE